VRFGRLPGVRGRPIVASVLRPSLIAVLLVVTACASAGGEWPSLARRPGETGGSCCPGVTPPAEPVAVPPGSQPPPVLPAPAPVDLAALEKRLDDARAAWARQAERSEAAVRAATGAGASDSAWAAAELELSRLEARGAEFREIADVIGVVTSPEQGRAKAAADAAYAEHVTAFDRLRSVLAAARP
jgi:hypothetical protein